VAREDAHALIAQMCCRNVFTALAELVLRSPRLFDCRAREEVLEPRGPLLHRAKVRAARARGNRGAGPSPGRNEFTSENSEHPARGRAGSPKRISRADDTFRPCFFAGLTKNRELHRAGHIAPGLPGGWNAKHQTPAGKPAAIWSGRRRSRG